MNAFYLFVKRLCIAHQYDKKKKFNFFKKNLKIVVIAIVDYFWL